MTVLALDLATNTGVCWGDGGALPTLAHNRLSPTGENVGAFLVEFQSWLEARVEEIAPTLVVFEAPILAKVTNITTVRKLTGLACVTEMIAEREGIECREVATSSVKKALTGKGTAKKPDMVRAARAYGLNPHTYRIDGDEASDEADAFGVWLAAIRARFPTLAARWTPLFAGAR